MGTFVYARRETSLITEGTEAGDINVNCCSRRWLIRREKEKAGRGLFFSFKADGGASACLAATAQCGGRQQPAMLQPGFMARTPTHNKIPSG